MEIQLFPLQIVFQRVFSVLILVLKMIGQECPQLKAFAANYIQNTPLNYLVRGCRKLSILMIESLVVDAQLLIWMAENLQFDVFQVQNRKNK